MSGRSRSEPKMSHNCGQRHEGYMTWSHDMVTFKMITLLLGVQARAKVLWNGRDECRKIQKQHDIYKRFLSVKGLY